MITTKGNRVTFSGKDSKWLERMSKELGLTPQNMFTGMMWEYVMRKAREGVFLEKGKKSVEI